MAANSSAHSAKAGYNQSGGAYFVCVTALSGALGSGVTEVTSAILAAVTPIVPLNSAATYLYKIDVAAKNSGGAYVAPTFEPVSAGEVFNFAAPTAATATSTAEAAYAATQFAAGKLIKDMGKTIIDIHGNTYRKFAVAATGHASYATSSGIVGGAVVAPSAGYGSFYLQVGRDGHTNGGVVPAPIARYF